MSDSKGHDDHGHGDAHGHADHGHDDFDPTPARNLSEGEPQSPSWLPILGAGLFLVGGVYFLSGQSDAAPGAASASASVSAAAKPVSSNPLKREEPADKATRQAVLDRLKADRSAKAAASASAPAPVATITASGSAAKPAASAGKPAASAGKPAASAGKP